MLKRTKGVIIRILSNDHNPRHLHASDDKGKNRFKIEENELYDKVLKIKPKSEKTVKAFIKENKTALIKEFDRLNPK